MAAEPGSSSAVLPSGTMRASNTLAAVTPSNPPTISFRKAVPGGSARPSPGLSHSAHESAEPPPGPPTISVAPSGNGLAAPAPPRARTAPVPRKRRRVIGFVTGDCSLVLAGRQS